MGTSCVYCNSSGNFEIIKNECKCKQGFFLENEKCNECHWTCLNCTSRSELSCINCLSYLNMSSDNLCLCQKDYYFYNHTCTTCNLTLNLVPDKHECVCKMGCYSNEELCLNCKDLIMNNKFVDCKSVYSNCDD